jgi:hypothetical protein
VKRFITLLLILLTSGCAATGLLFRAAPEPGQAESLVYIYRPSSFFLGGRDAYFYVNDVNVVNLSSAGYTWFHIPAGEYTLRQEWPFDIYLGRSIREIEAKWTLRGKYFYRLRPLAGRDGVSWLLTEVAPEYAIEEISACKLQPPSGIEKLLRQRQIAGE